MTKIFKNFDGAEMGYEFRGGKNVYLWFGNYYNGGIKRPFFTCAGQEYEYASISLRYTKGEWIVTSTPSIQKRARASIAGQAPYNNNPVPQDYKDVTSYFINSWGRFCTAEKMFEADIEKEEVAAKWADSRINTMKEKIKRLEDQKKKAMERKEKFKAKLKFCVKTAPAPIPQTPQAVVNVQNVQVIQNP